MNKKFSWSGTIVVLICVAFMLYYYLVYRHNIEYQIHNNPTKVDDSAKI